MTTQLSTMLIVATTRHAGQFDKGGKPYILHPLKVMHYLKTEDEELQCVALGHDMIEDTFGKTEPDIWHGVQFLKGLNFSERVIDGILAMTKREGQSHEEYVAQVKANPDAIRVKMADLRHNSDIRRLKGVTPKDIQRVAKYHRFYIELENCL